MEDDERLRCHELTDGQGAGWRRCCRSMFGRGAWADHRRVVNGVLHRVRAGCPWRDLPERYGPWKTVYHRHRRWSADGTWERILDGLRVGCDQDEGADWAVAVDFTVVRAHQHAVGARHAPPQDVPAERLEPVALSAPVRPGGDIE